MGVRAGSVTLAKLEAAQADVKSREYEKAIATTGALLDGLSLSTVEEIILAHKILGVSYCEIGEQAKAEEHFDELLAFSPTESIQDLVVTKPCAEMYVEIQQRSSAPPARITAASHGTSKTSEALTRTGDSSVKGRTDATNPSGDAWKRFVPFGVGQFANDQEAKGMAFLSGETVLFATAITSFVLFQNEKEPSGAFSNVSPRPTPSSILRRTERG